MRFPLMAGCLFVLFTMATTASAANVNDFINFSLTNPSGVLLPGRLYVPPEALADPTTPRPLVLFLHGAGESGTNNAAQVNGNIDGLLAEAKRRGAFLYAPQTNAGWSSATITDRVMTMVDRALADQNADASRVYVTGLSMGGGGTWNMLSRYADQFAAGVPICGVAPASGFVPANLVDQAIATFHARNDSVVSFQTSRNVIDQILTSAGESLPAYPDRRNTADFVFSAPGLDLNYIEFGLGGHGIWPFVYHSPGLYDWLFSHSIVPEPAAVSLWLGGMAMFVVIRRSRARRRSASRSRAGS